VTVEIRYFISSLPGSAQQVLNAVRLHWGVENPLHCCLDISFNEDVSRIRQVPVHTAPGIVAVAVSQSSSVDRPAGHEEMPTAERTWTLISSVCHTRT
jgi:hypothetical protein